MICPVCGTSFHYCSSCSISYNWETTYCSEKCWHASPEYTEVQRRFAEIYAALDPADRTVPMLCGVAAAGFVSAAICGHQFCVLLNDPFWCHDIDAARLLAVVMTGSIVATAFALHSLYCILSTSVKKTDTMRVDSEYFRCSTDRSCERIDPVWDQQKTAHFARVQQIIAGGYGDEYAHAVSVQLQKLYATHRPTTQSLRNTLIRRVTPAVSLDLCRRYNLPDGETNETDLPD